MTKRYMLVLAFIAMEIAVILCSQPENYFTNPSFEEGLKGWYIESYLCKVTNETAHTGNYSLYCNGVTGKSDHIAQWKYPTPGLRYRISGYFKIKSLAEKASIMLTADAGTDYGIWVTPKCPNATDPPCTDEWIFIEGNSTLYFTNSARYTLEVSPRGAAEFWVDDLKFEPILEGSLLRAAEVRSWRQEVFEDKVEVLADLLITGTCFQDGSYLNLSVDIIEDSTGQTIETITDYKIELRVENYLAVFILNPKLLNEGFYTVRVTMENSLFETTEIVETYMHKLGKKRNYKRYIDNYNRVIDADGKPFFPLGVYTDTMYFNDTEIDTITDSPFNIVVLPTWRKNAIDYIYNRSKGKLRSIPVLSCVPYSKNQTKIDESVECAKERYTEWMKSDGLFAYYLVDEPTLDRLPSMRAITLAMREDDYDHFIYSVINRRLELHKFKEGFDVVGVDDYPVQHFDELRSIVIVARQGRDRVMNSRAMWNVPQIFDWTYHNRTNESPPTEDQLRHMTYQFIVGGGMGIIYYHYSEIQYMGWKNPVEKEWAKVKKVAKELQDKYVPIIMSGLDINPNLRLPKDEDYMCYVRFFRYDGYDYALVMNAWDKRTIKCKFWVSNTTKSIKKLTGKSEIARDGNKLQFDMPAMDIVWLKMKDSKFSDHHTPMGDIDGQSPSSKSVASVNVPSLLFMFFMSFFLLMF